MKRLFRLRYPKLFALVFLCLLAYFLFEYSSFGSFVHNLGEFSYFGIFIAGILFSFGFTTPFAVGFFLTVQPENVFVAAIVGGCGALISDLLIFNMIHFSFMDEFKRLENTPTFRSFRKSFSFKPLIKLKIYFLYIFAGLIIASPLPDEVGVSMLAGLTSIRISSLAMLSFVMNTLGILFILWV